MDALVDFRSYMTMSQLFSEHQEEDWASILLFIFFPTPFQNDPPDQFGHFSCLEATLAPCTLFVSVGKWNHKFPVVWTRWATVLEQRSGRVAKMQLMAADKGHATGLVHLCPI